MFGLIARIVTRRAWVVAAMAAVVATVAAVFGISVAGSLTGGNPDFVTAGSQSDQASARFEDATEMVGDGGVLALVNTGEPLTSARTQAAVDRVTQAMESEPAFKLVLNHDRTKDPALVSTDRLSTYVVAHWKAGADDEFQPTVSRLLDRFADDPEVRLGGSEVVGEQVVATVHHDLAMAELLAFPVLFVLSLWIFRSLVASALPLVIGGLNVVLTMLGLRLVSQVTDLSIFALNLVTALGLGLAIDYSLLVVSRFRSELARGVAVAEAVTVTVNTAGRTIVYSSVTVSAAMASLFLFEQRFLFSMAVGGLLVAASAAMVALFVLPAILALLGHKVDFGSPARWRRTLEQPESTDGLWFRIARVVMRKPAMVAVAAITILLALGLPFAGVRFTGVGAKDLPDSASSRQVDDVLGEDFASNPRESILVVVNLPDQTGNVVQQRINQVLADDVRERIDALPGTAAVTPVQPLDDRSWLVLVDPREPGLSGTSQQLVKQIRDLPTQAELLVGGETANFVDLKESLLDHLPEAIAVVALSSMLVLWLMTGSVLLPLNALLMNLLTISATFGVLVLVFQKDYLADLLGFPGQGALDATQPILLFALVFGLSTDYGVFLLARMKEAHDAGASAREAVILGVGRTGRIVTAAALLFCVALGAMVSSQIVFIKELGFGTALGVLLDATIVRALLVPSLMALLGRWSWWSPAPLTALHQRFGLREEAAVLPAAEPLSVVHQPTAVPQPTVAPQPVTQRAVVAVADKTSGLHLRRVDDAVPLHPYARRQRA
ncbi:MAG TPA: MMPL family transporter [Propionibacteriaceae bacterium]|nr:MMPL family transporter [Propionibacteriaceae bacterium]